MQLRDKDVSAKAAIRPIAVLMVLSVAACEPAPPAAAVTQLHAPDPVLAFVSVGRVGQSGVVSNPGQGGNIIVVIDTQYNAASGSICRTYATTSSSVQAQHLACGDGTDWQEVPPLVTTTN